MGTHLPGALGGRSGTTLTFQVRLPMRGWPCRCQSAPGKETWEILAWVTAAHPATPPETVSPKLRSPPLCPLMAPSWHPPRDQSALLPSPCCSSSQMSDAEAARVCAGGHEDAVIGSHSATLCHVCVLQGAQHELLSHLPNQNGPARWTHLSQELVPATPGFWTV